MNTLSSLRNHRIRLLWAGFAFLYFAIALLVAHSAVPALIDERVHYGQIDLFDHGVFAVADMYLTMLPGYHIVAAAILWVTDMRSLVGARLLNALFGLFAIGAFHLLRRRAIGVADAAATVQFAVLPILFPYDFLVYTDVLSLALVLAAGAASLRGRHRLSGAVMVAAMGIRQINVIWLPLFAAFAIWPASGDAWPSWRQTLSRIWPYLLGVGLFVAYWIWNGSISLSKEQASMHPDWSLHIGNLYFALFVCGLLLPLQVIAGLKGYRAKVAARPWLVVLPIVAFAAYWMLFRVDHPFNQVTDPLMLHNYIIQQCRDNPWCKTALGLVAVITACGLSGTRLQPRAAWLVYPLAVVALSGFWMIEHRYALIPLALWLAFRERKNILIESATTALWTILAVCFCLGIFGGYFNL